MPRVVQSPVKKWPGSVTLAEPISFPQYIAWMEAIAAADNARRSLNGATPEAEAKALTIGDIAFLPRVSLAMLPGICAVVERWELEGLGQLTPETFPVLPRRASARLLIWLMTEISKLVAEADADPLE